MESLQNNSILRNTSAKVRHCRGFDGDHKDIDDASNNRSLKKKMNYKRQNPVNSMTKVL